ncbi:hypothetical protein NE237_004301 [Protea cynaroides]|uniref:UDP-glucuronate decarboxylase n=1 Tax=Protea cynaroides TaxID=273540 RepID=A0A9Q0QTG4_9MAGN|nr:hypothetical protein NE237_004301 [Protea cynaroides]
MRLREFSDILAETTHFLIFPLKICSFSGKRKRTQTENLCLKHQKNRNMKQLHKQSSLNHRRDEDLPTATSHSPYSPKNLKQSRSFTRSINYLLKEQRLLFILIGVLIASIFFILQPILTRIGPPDTTHAAMPREFPAGVANHEKITYQFRNSLNNGVGKVGRVPAGIEGRRLRVVVTGGAGFVGSHLVDKLLDRGDYVIVIDNFFTGRKENVMHHFGNPRFELIRHDVVEPILLEVDQIYHLACPASPVHYKFNPIKTIISFSTVIMVF